MTSLTTYILYEDDFCIVINKPSGISVHGDGKTLETTLADLILAERPEIQSVGEPFILKHTSEVIEIPRPGIVHRLDKETSGVLLIAKTADSFLFFKDAFKKHRVKKIYHAFLYGWPKLDQGVIDSPIARSKGDIRKWGTGNAMRGIERNAETAYRIIKKFTDPKDPSISFDTGTTLEGAYSFAELKPKTGRTHQLRVHMKLLNHPIVSDSLYTPKRKQALGFMRLALHARSLRFPLPGGEEKTIIAPYWPDFENALILAGLSDS